MKLSRMFWLWWCPNSWSSLLLKLFTNSYWLFGTGLSMIQPTVWNSVRQVAGSMSYEWKKPEALPRQIQYYLIKHLLWLWIVVYRSAFEWEATFGVWIGRPLGNGKVDSNRFHPSSLSSWTKNLSQRQNSPPLPWLHLSTAISWQSRSRFVVEFKASDGSIKAFLV